MALHAALDGLLEDCRMALDQREVLTGTGDPGIDQLAGQYRVERVGQQQGAVGLVAVHDLNLALRFCQHVLVLGGGSVLAAGDPAEVLTPALLQRAYGVLARVERCSEGNLLVLADTALPL